MILSSAPGRLLKFVRISPGLLRLVLNLKTEEPEDLQMADILHKGEEDHILEESLHMEEADLPMENLIDLLLLLMVEVITMEEITVIGLDRMILRGNNLI